MRVGSQLDQPIDSGCKQFHGGRTSFAPETEKAINDFIASYGKDSPTYDGSAYVVSDFDNTTSIFDITHQCSVYQLQSMSFSLDPEGLVAALSTGIDAEKSVPWLDDIGAAYSYLWENYGPFTAAGLDEQARGASKQTRSGRSSPQR